MISEGEYHRKRAQDKLYLDMLNMHLSSQSISLVDLIGFATEQYSHILSKKIDIVPIVNVKAQDEIFKLARDIAKKYCT